MEIILYLQQNIVIFYGITFILGLIVGSFLNVVVYRLPIMLEQEWQQQAKLILQIPDDSNANQAQPKSPFNLMFPGSHCPHCKHVIKSWENIPIISFISQRRKCSNCKQPISFRYPAIEALTGLCSVIVTISFGLQWITLAVLILTWCLIALTMIDFDHTILPDSLTLPLIWLGLLVNTYNLIIPLEQAVLGAMLGYLSLWSIYWVFKLITGKEGMGYGDFKLSAAIGAWIGWQNLPHFLLIASVIGSIIGISLIILFSHNRKQPFAFGPYLAISGWLVLLFYV